MATLHNLSLIAARTARQLEVPPQCEDAPCESAAPQLECLAAPRDKAIPSRNTKMLHTKIRFRALIDGKDASHAIAKNGQTRLLQFIVSKHWNTGKSFASTPLDFLASTPLVFRSNTSLKPNEVCH